MSEAATIRKLDETVINRIAAGEVIQRPANALKELIENSLDAKSTNIQISVRNGGLKLLQIQDNGTGIRKEDFEIVCERFTTSKLREFDDLSTISTYGFRGEALASISHVAHLTIQSRTANEKCAYKALYIDGKLEGAPKPTAGNQGTTITVEDLFYNMDVRKRALRSPAEEYQKVAEVISKYAIHNSHVGFCLKKSGDNIDIRTPPDSNYIDNIRIIYGNKIAREVIQFEVQNEPFKFKVHGYMTNVNYSTKKFVFLLFINNRLVDCQSLKKCIDQVYTTYLPKNMHPFVYLSLELDSRSVDVNVHPTKHEVHFLHEEQIVEIITTAMETKLLGSNNSRVFYTQAKLPIVKTEPAKLTDKENASTNKTVHAKELVRTDCTEQKLERFFGNPIKKPEIVPDIQNTSVNEDVSLVEEINPEIAEGFENMLLNKTNVSLNEINLISSGKEEKTETHNAAKASLVSRISKYDTEVTSILQLRKELEDNCHTGMRELFSQHVFVGCISPTQALLQHSTKLYLCNTQSILEELFYQILLYNFQNFGIIKFSNSLPLFELIKMALELPETGWTEEDGNKEELAQKATEILTEKGEMLKEYFSMDIDENGCLLSIPLLLEKHVPDISNLPMYVLRLATEVNWENEKECFQSFCKETALFYSQMTEESKDWKWTTQHVLYPAVKEYFLPPKTFVENAAVLQITDLPSLYKVFERC